METATQKKQGTPDKVNFKAGYKKSEIGWIPESWGIKRLTEVLSSTRLGGNYANSEVESPFPLIKMGNIGRGNIVLDKVEYISNKESLNELDLLVKGDILFNTRNTLELVGKVAIWNNELPKAYYNSNLLKLNFKPKFVGSNFFMNYNLNSYNSIKQLKSFATGTTSVAAIYTKDLLKLKIPLPPLPEQQKIAEILSTWDKAIELNQNLIEKMTLRKKGLMQQLLSGETRLKGFRGQWEEVKGGELFSNHSDKNHDGTLEVLSATQDKGVIPRSETGIDIKYDKSSLINYKKVEIGDFVISLRSFQGGIEYSNYEGLVSPAYTVLKEKKPISKEFYKEYLKTTNFIKRLNSIIYGIRDGKQISYKEFSTLKLLYPPIEEQKAIAKVLTTADNQIKVQENYLAQLQAQKKGLMQQLLTGQKRVKV